MPVPFADLKKDKKKQIDPLTEGITYTKGGIPQDIPIKTLDGTRINELTGKAMDPSGNISMVQHGPLQAQNPQTGPINIAGQQMTEQQKQMGQNQSMLQQEQMPIVQSKTQQKGFLERLSGITLKPAEIAANLIMRGASLLSGQSMPEWENTAESLAKTPGGKVLGVATGVAAIAAAGAGAAELAGGMPIISQETRLLIARFGFKGVTAKAIATNGVKTAAIRSSALKTAFGIGGTIVVGSRISTLPERMANDTKSAIVSNVQAADLINDSVKAGLITDPLVALEQYNQIEQQILSLESSNNIYSKIGLKNFLASKNNMVDIQNAKTSLQLKKAALVRMLAGVQQ